LCASVQQRHRAVFAEVVIRGCVIGKTYFM